ncbi:MAG: WG repeat-containing protein, partial [Sphingobacterium sp.]
KIIPFEYTYLVYEPAWESYIYAKDDYMGLINRKGEIDPVHRYNNLSNLSDGYAMYAVNDKHGLLNKQLEVVVPAAYDYILQYNHKYFIISEDSTSKILSIENQEVVLEEFKELYLAGEDNLFIASNDGVLYGYVNAAGETVIPFKYSYASPFSDGFALVALEDSEEFITINMQGEIIEQTSE